MSAAAQAPARLLIDQLASPVAVLTVRHQGRTHGTTVSTLTRVSSRPLLVGAALRAGSVLCRLASAEGRFAVNVLGGDQGALARWFASSARPDGAEQFAAVDWRPDPYTDAPLLRGALAHYACRLSGCFVVGDHEVLLGQVVRVTGGQGDPLMSYAGGLRTAALHPAPGQELVPDPTEEPA
ncbi:MULTISPECIES: flavin reductase family protein [Streptomyces]|uniref:flavin reductase family protein n=1 Tax=Streptomyces TaxID=1883 RepID=UPI000F76D004|nr:MULTISPECIES: flavin reductase family protein [Streptomyces]RST06955.1 flavin reductase [Streptomyces sp. WAC07149]GLX17144.1 monooxygenase [Streptomyces lavendulae subsp. lavendulae]GLX29652.1 monooxygenase [Streptomyces lavendulae subsp. lavendulae]